MNTTLKHRSSFELYPTGDESDAFGAAANLVVDWFVQKESSWEGSPVIEDLERLGANPLFWNYSMPAEYAGGLYDQDRWPALATSSVNDPATGDIAAWAVEYDEPDASHEDRRWHTTVCLERLDGDACRVSCEVACRIVGDVSEKTEPLPAVMAAPALVRNIIDLPWFVARKGSTQLRTVPHKLSPQTFPDFAASLVDPARRVPLALFCTGFNGNMPDHAKQLARRGLGNVNVYVLDWRDEDLRLDLKKLFTRGWPSGEYACPRESARVYLPGVNLGDHNGSMPHESFSREDLRAARASEFADTLTRKLSPAEAVQGVAGLAEYAQRQAALRAEEKAAHQAAEAEAAARAAEEAALLEAAAQAEEAPEQQADEESPAPEAVAEADAPALDA